MIMYSEKYNTEVSVLVDYYCQRLPACGPIALTEAEYKRGVDSLAGLHADLVRGSFVEWLSQRNYELSYNQTCSAFFTAAQKLNLLSIAA
jgi:hypothetical protein